jgi:Chaperone of endosialidase
MNFINNRNLTFTTILLALGFLAPSPMAYAVSPAPDGGYPGGNTAEGQNALLSLTTGSFNTAVGFFSLKSDIAGQFNTAIGAGVLVANSGDPSQFRGISNTATGAGALLSNSTGSRNTATGAFALLQNTTGFTNTANGEGALFNNTSGGGNTAVGDVALNENSTGSFNTAMGSGALLVAGGNSNTAVGAGSGGNVVGANNVICIGQGVAGANVNDSCYIGNIWNQPGGSQAVYVNSDGKLGALVSSRRFKDNITPMDHLSEVIYALKPVSFRYKPEIDPTRPVSFGLVAEDVEKVNPDLVVRDTEGKPYSVRYDQVNAMLLNEFLKEENKVEDQECRIQEQQVAIMEAATNSAKHATIIARQQKQIEALSLGLQKVNAQLDLEKRSARIVASGR